MSDDQKSICAAYRGHLRKIQRRTTSNMDGFDEELKELYEVDRRVRSNVDEFYTGSKGSSEAKNRFPEVKPNEGTMVHLKGKNGGDTYINANFIDGRIIGVPFVYIAAQAPLRNTVLDFWRMIRENNVCFVVMLCATQEGGTEKSATYWPPLHEEHDLGPFSIRNESENYQNESVYRTLVLIEGSHQQHILHMQHTAWPDQSVPQASAPLMKMIQTMGASPTSLETPILVHCSGGVGRTGIFIALHIALAQFQQETPCISIPRIVRFLKTCRSGMVHRKDQYVFLCYATLREMDRMLLSAETGTDALDLLPPEHRAPVVRSHPWPQIRVPVVQFPLRESNEADNRSEKNQDPNSANKKQPKPKRDVAVDTAFMRAYLRRRGVLERKQFSFAGGDSLNQTVYL